jgi:hypothetical protein
MVSYLPKTAILNLGATSKSFGAPFRYRYLFSGTESFPVQTFRDIAAQPVLGDYAREMIIDLSFLNPPLKDQWYLDGENIAAKTTAWEVARSTKAALISEVLNATRRVRSLIIIGEDGARLATDEIAAAVTRLGRQSLRKLELTPSEGSLLDKLGNYMNATCHLVLTGGVYDDVQSSRVVKGLMKLPMLQSIHFIEAERPEQGECEPLFNHLQVSGLIEFLQAVVLCSPTRPAETRAPQQGEKARPIISTICTIKSESLTFPTGFYYGLWRLLVPQHP